MSSIDAGSVHVEVTATTDKLERALTRSQRKVESFADATRSSQARVNASFAKMDALEKEINQIGRSAPQASAGLNGMGVRLGAIGVAAAVGLQALGEASKALRVTGAEAATTEGRFRNLGAELLSGNVVGGLKAIASGAMLSNDQIERMGVLAYASTDALDAMISKLESAGGTFAGVAEKLKLVNVSARDLRIQDAQSVAGRETGTKGLQDKLEAQRRRGQFIRDQLDTAKPGTVAYTKLNAQLTTAVNERRSIEKQIEDAGKKKVDAGGPATSVSQRLQTALAGAFASPGTRDDLAQLRRVAAALPKLLGQKGLTDKGREDIYTQIASVNAQIASLTKTKAGSGGRVAPAAKEAPIVPASLELALAQAALTKSTTDDLKRLRNIEAYLVKKIQVEKDINRKIQETNRLADTRAQIASFGKTAPAATAPADPSAVLGALGSGPFLSSGEVQTAKSYGYKPKAADFLRDINQQVSAGQRLENALLKLKRRGAPAGVVSELAGQGIAGADEAQALAGASKTTLKKFGQQFGKRQGLANDLVRMSANTVTVTAASVTVSGGGRGGSAAEPHTAILTRNGVTGNRR